MEAKRATVDLDRLALRSGGAERVELDVPIDPVQIGGQTYALEGGRTPVRLDVSKTTTGYALRLRLEPVLDGPCVRCLTEARLPLEIDAREVDQPAATDEELRSPYVEDGIADVGHWANDAVVLALPAQPLCREDCAGLCAVCGESLNDAEPGAHDHPSGGDSRMAKLKDLKLD
jgi:uncharacterized protein